MGTRVGKRTSKADQGGAIDAENGMSGSSGGDDISMETPVADNYSAGKGAVPQTKTNREMKRTCEGKSTDSMETTGSSPLVDLILDGLMPMPSLERTVPSGPGAYAVSRIRYAWEQDTNINNNEGVEQGLDTGNQDQQDSTLVQAYPVSDPVGTATPQKIIENHAQHVFKRSTFCVLVSVVAGVIAIISSSLTIPELLVRDPKGMEHHQQTKQTILDAFGESYFDNPQKKKALNWITYQDPRNGGTKIQDQGYHQSTLIQRFSLVAFYFQTTTQQQWKYCNPPVEEQSETCFYIEADSQKHDKMGTRWLTAAHECQWMGVICETGTRAVKELQLGNNNMTGSIPAEELMRLTSLRKLLLYKNDLTGTLPNSLLQISSLQVIYLYSNNLRGGILPQIFLMPRLTRLILKNNQFTGSIPPEVGNFGGDLLVVSNNLLTGSIPQEIYRATKLQNLVVGNNMLTGTLSHEIGSLSQLSRIDLGGNPVGGFIASEIGLLQNLFSLEVSRSGIAGTIPEELYRCLKLTHILLNKNQLSGTISTRVGLLKELSHFEFESTKIGGTLPEELGSLSGLVRLATSGNGNLTGSIPESLCAHGSQRLKVSADCMPLLSTGLSAVFCPKGCCSECCDAETKICLDQ